MPASLTSVDEELALGGEREPAGEIAALLDQLEAIRAEMLAAPTAPQSRLEKVHPKYRDSARNLLHYLALRRHDLRSLQPRLAALGLSSLGRAEPHALATVEAVLAALHRLAGGAPATAGSAEAVGFGAGERLLATHSEALLGPPTAGREVRIMVTMPSEAGEDYALVHSLLRQGMDCMRINCAHDDATTWLRMIEHLRRAERALGRSCRVVMDLGGPKLRTGPLEPGPQVVRVRPRRDAFGQVVAPARIWLTPASAPAPSPSPADACLPMPAEWLARLRPGRRISLEDSRDARRLWTVVEAADGGCWAEAVRTAYVVSGTVLRLEPEAGEKRPVVARVGTLPASEAAVPLRQGDLLVVTGDLEPGRAATHDSAGQLLSPARIGCTIPEVLADVRSGDAIWFDDGKIGGLVRKAEPARLQVEITRARLRGEKLRADKGINLPDSPLRLGALTAKDLQDLPFVAAHADVVELSFANSAADLEELQENLARLGSRQPAAGDRRQDRDPARLREPAGHAAHRHAQPALRSDDRPR